VPLICWFTILTGESVIIVSKYLLRRQQTVMRSSYAVIFVNGAQVFLRVVF